MNYLIRCCFIVCLMLLAAPSTLAQKTEDMERGHYSNALFQDSYQILDDEELTARVSEIGHKIVVASGNPHGYPFRFIIVNSANPNAFTIGAGYVYVTTGLLQSLESEDELAAVLAHEVGHVNERHPMKTGMGIKGKLLAIGIYFGTEFAAALVGAWVQSALAPYVTDMAMAQAVNRLVSLSQAFTAMAVSQVGQIALMRVYRGYTEGMEFKSDELALTYTKAAGYNPEALTTALGRFLTLSEAEKAGRMITYLHSSRDRLEKRLKKTKEVLAQTSGDKTGRLGAQP